MVRYTVVSSKLLASSHYKDSELHSCSYRTQLVKTLDALLRECICLHARLANFCGAANLLGQEYPKHTERIHQLLPDTVQLWSGPRGQCHSD